MRNLLGGIVFVLAALTGPSDVQAGDGPIVVELFTSQGCSSCPPADKLLGELAKRDDVLALALHVDYWDYIGWKDSFADPRFTKRQRKYAYVAGARTVYTPQMIIEGKDHVIGYKPMQVADLLAAHKAKSAGISVSLEERGGKVFVEMRSQKPLGTRAVVQLVRFIPQASVDIRSGENRGRKLTYYNIVTELSEVGQWSGRTAFKKSLGARGEGELAVIVQSSGFGPVLAAARLR
ncbi:MAG: DUF1223 domain-containing protein [Brevirhabdus sp.]